MTRSVRATILLAVSLLPSVAGCVKSSTHDRALDQLAQTEGRAERMARELEQARTEHAAEAARLRRQVQELEFDLERTGSTVQSRDRTVTELRDRVLGLENENERLSTLLGQTGDEAILLRRRLDALASLEQEVRERNRIYEEVIGRFRSLIDAGQLSVSISRGRLAINLPQDILFPSGSAELNREGRETLAQVARVLADIPERAFQVEGHTDTVPIATARFPSNWELASARALAVVHLLQQEGVAPGNVSGAAYGEYQPVASNDDADGRRLNRRIEIVMLPNLDVIAGATLPP